MQISLGTEMCISLKISPLSCRQLRWKELVKYTLRNSISFEYFLWNDFKYGRSFFIGDVLHKTMACLMRVSIYLMRKIFLLCLWCILLQCNYFQNTYSYLMFLNFYLTFVLFCIKLLCLYIYSRLLLNNIYVDDCLFMS